MMLILTIVILKLFIMLDLWFGIVDIRNTQHVKKIDERLLPVASHPTRVWNCCISQDEKIEVESFLIDKN